MSDLLTDIYLLAKLAKINVKDEEKKFLITP